MRLQHLTSEGYIQHHMFGNSKWSIVNAPSFCSTLQKVTIFVPAPTIPSSIYKVVILFPTPLLCTEYTSISHYFACQFPLFQYLFEIPNEHTKLEAHFNGQHDPEYFEFLSSINKLDKDPINNVNDPINVENTLNGHGVENQRQVMNKEINAQPNSKTWIVVEIKPIELCKIVIRKWVLHIK